MLFNSIAMAEGTEFANLTVATGTSFPASANAGELFYRTDLDLLHVYNGSSWDQVGSGGGSGGGSIITPGHQSVYFDGNGDYLTVPNNAAHSFGSTPFTVELWFYCFNGASLQGLVGNFQFSNSNGWRITVSSNAATYYQGNGTDAVSLTTFANKTWNHVAVVGNGTTITLYLNGVAGTNTAVQSAGITSGGYLSIGKNSDDSSGITWPLNGYISNLRIVKGTALYTSNFTVPAQPLTAITNTTLLTAQSSTFVDNSANYLGITPVGNSAINALGPFSGVSPIETTGNSVYFDGTGDYLTYTTVSVGAGVDFCAEAWIYPTKFAADTDVIFGGPSDNDGGANNVQLCIFPDASGNSSIGGYMGAQFATSGANRPIKANQWNHVAWTRASGTSRVFVNGLLAGSLAHSAAGNISRLAALGSSGDIKPYQGFISDARIVVGNSVYTSNFTVPAQPLTAITNTSLLTAQSSVFTDNSTNNLAITAVGDSAISTSSPFDASAYSVYLDGNGDYLTVPYNINLLPVSGTDYTAECWVYCTARSEFHNVMGMNSTTLVDWRIMNNNGTWQAILGGQTINGPSVALNTWVHLAIVQSSNTISFYVNGVSQGSGAGTSWPSNSMQLTIGAWSEPGRFFSGYISNLRIVKGTAVYTSNFTVPTQPLTAITNTSLLTARSSAFADYSGNSLAITAVGNSAISTSSPFDVSEAGSDPYFNQTALLLNFAGTNTTKKTYDASTVQHTLTFGTNASISSTQSKYGGTSAYFTGTSPSYINVGSDVANYSALDLSQPAMNCTVEAWAYPTAVPTETNGYVIWWGDNTTTPAIGISITSAGMWRIVIGGVGGASATITTSTAATLNAWTHLAFSKTGEGYTGANATKMQFYVNGVLVGTATVSVTFSNFHKSSQPWRIGSKINDTLRFIGYIDDVRITKGVGRYTANFMPPAFAHPMFKGSE